MDRYKLRRVLTFLISQQPVAFLTILAVRLSSLINNFEFFILLMFFSIIPSLSLLTFIKFPWNYEKERKVSFFINIVSFISGFAVIYFSKCNNISFFIALAYNITGALLSLINAFGYKASGHAASIAGPATTLTILLGAKGSLLYLLLLPASYLKIKLRDHTVMQFVTGIFIAVVSTVIAYYLTGGV